MDPLANNTVNLRQGGKDLNVSWHGIPIDDRSWEACVSLTVFKKGDF